MIDQDLVAYIKSLATAAGARVHLGNAEQETLKPFVVIRRTGGNTPRTLGGTALFARAEFSINVIADTHPEAYPTANAIRDALRVFRGTMGETAVQSTRVLVEPVDRTEVDGDKVTRWMEQQVLIVHR